MGRSGVKILFVLILGLLLSSCAFLNSGGTYRYHYEDPSGKVVDVKVDSVRKVGPTKVRFSPDGTVDIQTESLNPGPNNIGRALTIIDGLVKAGALVAVP